jgi:hypothetical protein
MFILSTHYRNFQNFAAATAAGGVIAIPITVLYGAFRSCETGSPQITNYVIGLSTTALCANAARTVLLSLKESSYRRTFQERHFTTRILSPASDVLSNFCGGFTILSGSLMKTDTYWTCETSSHEYASILLCIQIFFIFVTLYQMARYNSISHDFSQRRVQVAPAQGEARVEIIENDADNDQGSDNSSETAQHENVFVIHQDELAIIQAGGVAVHLPGSLPFFPYSPTATIYNSEPTAPPPSPKN